jgi:predicted Rossmann fold nucleotide-binding protein DprA/Smf involved in DNA uptake
MSEELTKTRAQILKDLRQEHSETVERTQAYLKEQQKIRKELKAAMKAGPMTVPEIAQAAELPADIVLWHVVTMKKYDQVVEVGQAGEYYQYALAKEDKS